MLRRRVKGQSERPRHAFLRHAHLQRHIKRRNPSLHQVAHLLDLLWPLHRTKELRELVPSSSSKVCARRANSTACSPSHLIGVSQVHHSSNPAWLFLLAFKKPYSRFGGSHRHLLSSNLSYIIA